MDKYEKKETLGQGQFGIVFKAKNKQVGALPPYSCYMPHTYCWAVSTSRTGHPACQYIYIPLFADRRYRSHKEDPAWFG